MTAIAAPDAATRGDPAVLADRQALRQAQARVDTDHRNHSPSCVAIDQRGVQRATTALAQATAKATSGLSLVA